MKTIRLTIILFVLPFTVSAQKTLTGLWTGTVSNDSSTIRKDQSFEIVLTQYKDKVYGYSRMTFFVRDTLYYIVKRVKGTIDGDICEVKDDDILKHNFPVKPEKGVKLINLFRRNPADSSWSLDGDWKTTETKRHRYYSISGKMSLKEEPDLEKSKLIPHLEELKVTEEIAVYQEAKQKKEAEIAAAASIKQKQPDIAKETKRQPTVIKEEKPTSTTSVTKAVRNEPVATAANTNTIAATTKPADLKKEMGAIEEKTVAPTNNQSQTQNQPARNEVATNTQQPVANKPETKPSAFKGEPVSAQTQATAAANVPVNNQQKPNTTAAAKTEPQKIDQPGTLSPVEQKKEVATAASTKPQVATNLPITKPVIPEVARLEERKIGAQQVVFFKSDSLQLSLYDNGEIDGDTVSILINGELVMTKQGLKATAIKKTVYVPSGQTDSLTLELYAENLGKYPPNTGLLVVHDGDDTYQVRFSADLKQNAAVIFKRKRF